MLVRGPRAGNEAAAALARSNATIFPKSDGMRRANCRFVPNFGKAVEIVCGSNVGETLQMTEFCIDTRRLFATVRPL